MADSDLCSLTATRLAALIRSKDASAREVMEAYLARIEELNPQVNAIVSLIPEQALSAAAAADEIQAKSDPYDLGPLHGLPIAHKDLTETAGLRTTYGSSIFSDHTPEGDSLLVERLRKAGALLLGKTNTPEFGVGSQTFNQVFGTTRNPYDLSKTAGGSSGGAAAAVAARMLPLADGSDLGGSLRNPGSFNNVVGFRPSGQRVPVWPNPLPWFTMPVEGPIARTTQDAALLLSAMAGPDRRSPVVLQEDPAFLRRPLVRDFAGARVAWAPDFGGLVPVEDAVRRQVDERRSVFEELGCHTEEAMLDLEDADQVFRTLRALLYAIKGGPLLEEHRSKMKDTLIENTEAGLRLTGVEVGEAECKRAEIYHRTREFFELYDYLVLPTVQVLPFSADVEWVREIEGHEMPDYLGWMASCYLVTVTGHPAISVPAGFVDGLPVGLQIVGRHPDDFGLLQFAHAYERATEFWKREPAGCVG